MSFWDTYDDRPLDVHPGYEHLTPRQMTVDECIAVAQCSHEPCSQNESAGVCDWCGIASDDVLLGVCAGCVKD
jgi:hypothetical protein